MSRRSRRLDPSSNPELGNTSHIQPPQTPGQRRNEGSFQVPQTPGQHWDDNDSDNGEDNNINKQSDAPTRGERIRGSSQRFAATQAISTPRRSNDTRHDAAGQSTRLLGKVLKKTLGGVIEANKGWVLDSLKVEDILDRHTAGSWLRSSSSNPVFKSDSGDPDGVSRWQGLERTPSTEEQLYGGVVKIVNAILSKFCRPVKQGVGRVAMDTHNKKFTHKDKRENKTSPDIIVCARGPSFQVPCDDRDDDGKRREFGYSNTLIVIDVKLDTSLGGGDAHLEQFVVYGRQIFAHQPNRKFVRGILMSEKRARLIHFDHAGVQVAPDINIHGAPETFVVLIAGLCGADESKIGFDDSIQWKIEKKLKVDGTLRALDGNNQEVTYELEDTEPIAHDYDIRGRSTTYWAVRDPRSDKRFVIKDTWSSEDRMSEHLHLLKARGLPGVCQIVAFQHRDEIRNFRCPTTASRFFNRVAERVTMEAYGEPVGNFGNMLQLFEALRDAISGHEALFIEEILHRDISDKNIVLGRGGSPNDLKGILINLSVALDFSEEGSTTITKEARPGSRFFQSCSILSFLTKLRAGPAPAHDHLDDLEALFYVLCVILFTKLPDGRDRKSNSRARNVIKDWDHERADEALRAKALLFHPTCTQQLMAIELVGKSWGPVCQKLFKSYLEWVILIQKEKTDLVEAFVLEQREAAMKEDAGRALSVDVDESESDDDERAAQDVAAQPRTDASMRQGIFTPLILKAEKHYNDVLEIFTIAIVSLRSTAGLPPGSGLKRHSRNSPAGEVTEPVRKSARRL